MNSWCFFSLLLCLTEKHSQNCKMCYAIIRFSTAAYLFLHSLKDLKHISWWHSSCYLIFNWFTYFLLLLLLYLYRGNFGTVRRVTHKETGIKYAAKFLRRRRRAACWTKQIQHEIAVLMLSSDSEQIVKLHAVYETRSEFVLILEM